MERIKTQKHHRDTFYYSLSRMLERASYFGLRSILVLYMLGELLEMQRSDALTVYVWFIGSLVFAQIIGALFGDLLIGNKKAVILGGVLQAIGAFTLCFPSIFGLYICLFLIVVGSGLYTPNIISSFGKLYFTKNHLLDAAFTIFKVAVNLGSFLGIILIGYIGETYGYNIGFIIAGILMLLSLVPFFIVKDQSEKVIIPEEKPIRKSISYISISFIAVGIFWTISEISNIRIFDLQFKFSEISSLDISRLKWESIEFYLFLTISFIAIFLWTFFYSTQIYKLLVGCIFGIFSIGILLVIPEVPDEKNIFIYIISMLFLVISEIHISPIIHSVLTKYSNPKYLAIVISLAFLPSRLLSLSTILFYDTFYENPNLGLKFGLLVMTAVGIILFLFLNNDRRIIQNIYN